MTVVDSDRHPLGHSHHGPNGRVVTHCHPHGDTNHTHSHMYPHVDRWSWSYVGGEET